jgi:hypothetical protein
LTTPLYEMDGGIFFRRLRLAGRLILRRSGRLRFASAPAENETASSAATEIKTTFSVSFLD